MSNWILSDKEPSRRKQPDGGPESAPAEPQGKPQPVLRGDQAAGKQAIAERKRARRVALQALFEIDSVGHSPDIVLYERMEASTRARQQALVQGARTLPAPGPDANPGSGEDDPEEGMTPLSEAGVRFLLWLVAGVLSYRERIDDLIHRYAPEWPVEKLAIVDRSILRLALYELGAREGEAPAKVVINEAVELAKAFGSDSTPRFVNGVLGAAFDDARKQGF